MRTLLLFFVCSPLFLFGQNDSLQPRNIRAEGHIMSLGIGASINRSTSAIDYLNSYRSLNVYIEPIGLRVFFKNRFFVYGNFGVISFTIHSEELKESASNEFEDYTVLDTDVQYDIIPKPTAGSVIFVSSGIGYSHSVKPYRFWQVQAGFLNGMDTGPKGTLYLKHNSTNLIAQRSFQFDQQRALGLQVILSRSALFPPSSKNVQIRNISALRLFFSYTFMDSVLNGTVVDEISANETSTSYVWLNHRMHLFNVGVAVGLSSTVYRNSQR